jgi:putative ABC transport system permease protein
MSARVPVARRALFQDRRRAALAAGGVAAALLLVLLLQGIFDGAMRQVTAYLRSSPADVIVSQQDVRTMHMSVSALDPATVDAVAEVDGVAWAEGILYTTTFLTGPNERQQLSYVIGYDVRTGRAGPRKITDGRPPRRGEVLLERVAADRLAVGVGDTIRVFGDPFRVAGLFHGGTTIVNSMAFMPTADFAARRGESIAYVFAGAERGVSSGELARRITDSVPAVTVQTRSGFAAEEAGLVRDMSADLMQIMSVVALLIGLAVIGLTLFTLTLSKLREHAVLKAMGSRTRRLLAIVLAQAAWSVALAVTLATALAVAIGALVGRVNPSITIAIEPRSVVRVGVAAAVIGAIGAVIPLRRVATVDPASAFRRAS